MSKDVRVEPFLMKLNVEEQTMRRTAKKNNEHRLDISVKRFWVNGQNAFFDVMVFDPNARWYSNQTLKQCYSLNENEKASQ